MLFYSWIIFHCIYLRRLCLIGNTFWLSSAIRGTRVGRLEECWLGDRSETDDCTGSPGVLSNRGAFIPHWRLNRSQCCACCLVLGLTSFALFWMSRWSMPAGQWDAQALFAVSQENPVILSSRPDMRCRCSAEVSAVFRSLLVHRTRAYYTVSSHHSQSIIVASPTHQNSCVAPQINTDGIFMVVAVTCKEVKHTGCPYTRSQLRSNKAVFCLPVLVLRL